MINVCAIEVVLSCETGIVSQVCELVLCSKILAVKNQINT